MDRKQRLTIDWPNIAILFGGLGAISGLTLLLGL
jgi:hypothetical protein